jgi:hypothetical protein
VISVTETIAVRKYSVECEGFPQSGGDHAMRSRTHERTDFKHYGFILALVCMWLALVVASAAVFAAFD